MGKDGAQWFETASIDRYKLLKEFAKENRRHMTDAEKVLWKVLRQSECSFKFRRQHPIYDYIADFICLEKRLIIEVDGATIANPSNKKMTKSVRISSQIWGTKCFALLMTKYYQAHILY